jgi:TRAP-type mannitol/chloroaromatic compound transport system permease large subunit
MYEGAFVPGLVLAAMYAAYIFGASLLNPAVAPGLPAEAVGFRETPQAASKLSRANAVLLIAIVAAFLAWYGGSLTREMSSGLAGGFGGKLEAVIIVAFLAWLLYSVYQLIGVLREGGDERGLLSLLSLTLLSGAFGVWYMNTYTKVGSGADFVILAMSLSVAAAFAVAVVNWIAGKLFGIRFLSKIAQEVTFVMVPPLALIFLVLGTIFIGVATPTEGGAMGAAGALVLAGFKRWLDNDPKRFNFEIIRQATESTAKLSAFVIFILVGARIFSLTFYGVNGHIWVEEILRATPGGFYGFLILVNVSVFLLAFFLDFFELAFIVVPLLKPAAEAIFITDPQALAIAKGFNLTMETEIKKNLIVWFGIMLAVNMQTSFMHPPFGFALFYLRSVAPKEPFVDKVTGKLTEPVTTGQIYWGAVPFVVIQMIMVAVVMLVPAMVITKKPERPAVDPAKALEQLQNLRPGGLDLPPINLGPPVIR